MKSILLGVVIAVGLAITGWFGLRYLLIGRFEARVNNDAAAHAAGPELARLCQSDPTFLSQDRGGRPAWLPPEVAALRPNYVRLEPDGGRVEFGGGFHHFGYGLERDVSKSTPASNAWKLSFYSEDDATRELYAFTLAVEDRFDRAILLAGALAEFDHLAATGSDRAARERIAFELKHAAPDAARAAIFDATSRHELDWLDHALTLILLDDATTRPDVVSTTQPAVADLERWAEAKDGLFRWLALAHAYVALDRPADVARCADAAARYPAIDPDGGSYNLRAFGINVCRYLATHGRTSPALCEKLLAEPQMGSYLVAELSALRDGTPVPRPADADAAIAATGVEPFKSIDLAALRTR